MISHAGQSWGFLTFITEVPTYMSSVLKFDIKKVSGPTSELHAPLFDVFLMHSCPENPATRTGFYPPCPT